MAAVVECVQNAIVARAGAWTYITPILIRTVPSHQDTVVFELPAQVLAVNPRKIQFMVLTDIHRGDNYFVSRKSFVDIFTKEVRITEMLCY
jgi:hypothetical protein